MADNKYPTFEIILGSYEEFTLGYKIQHELKNIKLVQSFATHDHSGSIRAVGGGGRFIATGASDDRIFVYDMIMRREHTVLTHHSGTVTSLAFTPDGSHLLSAGDDGVIAAVRVGNWQLEKTWPKAHGGTGIQAISIHPSGKLALSLANDITLRTWNLVKGRQAYIIRLQPHMRSARVVEWALDEKTFVICSNNHIEIWDIQCGGCVKKIEAKFTVTSIRWMGANLIVGTEDGTLAVYDSDLELLAESKTHSSRVKCIASEGDEWIVSAESVGQIILWRYKDNKLKCIAQTSTGCRITCICLVESHLSKDLKAEDGDVVKEDDTELSVDDTFKNNSLKATRKSCAYIVEEYEDNVNSNKKSKKPKKSGNIEVLKLNDADMVQEIKDGDHIERIPKKKRKKLYISTASVDEKILQKPKKTKKEGR